MKTKAEYHTFHETSTARSRKWINEGVSMENISTIVPKVRVRLA
jgi:hypothetical protein